MRRRINRTLLTATAASASLISLSFMAAGGAGAATTAGPVNGAFGGAPIVTDTNCTLSSTPVPSDGCARAGYQASGRDFRYAAASIVVPNHTGAAGNIAATYASGTTPPALTPAVAGDATMYVALDDSGDVYDYARVGIKPTCTTVNAAGACVAHIADTTAISSWSVFATVAVNGTVDSTPFVVAIPVGAAGLGVSVSAYLLPSSNWVRFVITTPATTSTSGGTTSTTAGKTYNRSIAVGGPTYTDAQAVADWSGLASTSASTSPAQPVLASAPVTAYDQFFQGRLTTWSGTKGTFNGKWTVNPIESTLAGAAPAGRNVVTSPSYLWSNDKGFSNDAFGVWIHSAAS
jgi:hypothetical protein